MQAVQLTVKHDVRVEPTPQGIKIGTNLITWSWLEEAKARVNEPRLPSLEPQVLEPIASS